MYSMMRCLRSASCLVTRPPWKARYRTLVRMSSCLRGWRCDLWHGLGCVDVGDGLLAAQSRQDQSPGRGDDAEDRDDEEHAEDPRDGGSSRDGHQHDRRVEVDGASIDDRTHDVALDDVED